MLVLVLVFVMTVIGCVTNFEYVYQIQNNTNFQITNVDILEINTGKVLQRDSTGIASGKSKTYTMMEDNGSPSGFKLTVAVGGQDVEVETSGPSTIKHKEAKKFSLSGNSADKLIISILN